MGGCSWPEEQGEATNASLAPSEPSSYGRETVACTVKASHRAVCPPR
jgi:hypothetical protein